MRIACIHIPQFALQCATRVDPAQRGAAVAVVSSAGPDVAGVSARGVLHAPIVVACSRAAWALGVRLGMTATAARQVSAQGASSEARVEVVSVDASVERETVRAIADAVLALTGVVDIGGRIGGAASGSAAGAHGAHLAMYAEVPAKTRGHAFGERVLERLAELGLTGRVGIADDRFTAWVAAAWHDSHDAQAQGNVTMVPRGGSPAFLAPRPLSLLAISSEVQHMLEALGVRTLGEFAQLPAPSVASRPPALEADYQALARGESGTLLRPYAPEAAIREDIVIGAAGVLDGPSGAGAATGAAISGPTAVSLLARRIALRLAGRDRAAARLEIAIGHGANLTERVIELDKPVAEAEELARVLAPALADPPAGAWRLRVVVVGEVVATAGGEDGEEAAPVFTLSQERSRPSPSLAIDSAHLRVAPASGAPGSSGPSLGREIASTATRVGEARRASESLATAAYAPHASDPLAVVLSTPGALFALSPPNAPNGRHRTLRKPKVRTARRPRAVTMPGQSRLFDRG